MDSEPLDPPLATGHSPLIPDYVLGLLSADESRRIEQHAHACPTCREAIRRERQVGALLRQTVQIAARPPVGRLDKLRPTPRPVPRARRQLYRQLAPLTALATLLLVVLLAQTRGYGLSTPVFAQTSEPATATVTSSATPTATLAGRDEAASPAADSNDATATLIYVPRPDAPALALAAPPPPDAPPAATPVITYVR